PHRILVASQCPPEVTTEITLPPPAPQAPVCQGQPAILEVLAPSSLHPPQEEMQKDTSLPPPSGPLASNTALDAGLQASSSGLPSKSEAEHRTSPNPHRKPRISKVILGFVADKGAGKRVSLAALKKAVATRGYNMTRNAWRFKRVLKGLVDKGMLKQVTGKGATGSFLMGKNHASKFKLKAKRRRQRRQQSGQRRYGQRRPGQRRVLMGSKQGHKRPIRGVRRAARCRRS
ncbi:hypothetical protein FD754_009326, partial [Muntiacus muntjak]